jgi:hypothetical protein
MGIYMLFGAILFLVYTVAAVVLLAIGLFLESRKIRIAGCIALAPPVAAIVWLALAMRAGEKRSEDPAWVFEQEFRTPPPPGVTGLRGHATQMNNGGWVYLSFSAPPEVIEALVSDWMAPASPKDLPRSKARSDDSPPFWWNPPDVPPAKFYRAKYRRTMCDRCGFSEVLYYDPATHVAYFGRL